MSAKFIVDASVGFAWVYQGQATPGTDHLLNEVAAGARVIVPALWYLEMSNVLAPRSGDLKVAVGLQPTESAARSRRVAPATLAPPACLVNPTDGDGGWHPKQDMDVILRAADEQGPQLILPRDAAQGRPKRAPACPAAARARGLWC